MENSAVLILLIFLYIFPRSVFGISIPFLRAVSSAASFGVSKDFIEAREINSDGNVRNIQNVRYTTTINLNGHNVVVALDTGSSDLWVYYPQLGNVFNTSIDSGVQYGNGTYGVSGVIALAPLEFGPHKVEAQAFLWATEVTLTGITDLEIDGLFGLGFNGPRASNIDATIRAYYGDNATWGQPFLTNLFAQNPSMPNFIAMGLTRTDDLEDTSGGSFDISEYDPRYTAVQDAPKLPVYPQGVESWQTLLEGITVEGKKIPLVSGVQGTPVGNVVALLDTGTPTMGFTSKVVDAIYGSVPGAAYDQSNSVWVLPCNITTDVSFSFGGQSFPIHPLDLSTPQEVTVLGNNYTACYGSFIGIDGWSYDYDYLLGDSFLRNAYTVYNYGDTNEATHQLGGPYIQLLSLTDRSTTAAEAMVTRQKTLSTMAPELEPSALIELM